MNGNVFLKLMEANLGIFYVVINFGRRVILMLYTCYISALSMLIKGITLVLYKCYIGLETGRVRDWSPLSHSRPNICYDFPNPRWGGTHNPIPRT